MANSTCDRYEPLEIFQEFHKYSTFSISIGGIFLNLLCLTVLLQPSLDNVFNRIRIMLATFDLLYLLSNTVYLFSAHFSWNSWVQQSALVVLAICSSGSAYSTVSLAVERCYAIFFPLNCHETNLDGSSRRKTFLLYFFPVVIISVIHNLPTLLSSGSAFQAYFSHANGFKIFTIVLTVIRIVFYISANSYVLWILKNKSSIVLTECQFLLQFLLISISSIILHLAWISFLISGQFPTETEENICGLAKNEEIWHKILYDFSDILFVLNSAGNFFIYNFIGDSFRKALKKTYRRYFESAAVKAEDFKSDVKRRGSEIGAMVRRGSTSSQDSGASSLSTVPSSSSA